MPKKKKKESYHAARTNQKEANKKVAKMAAKAAEAYFTGGGGGAAVDKLADTKLGDKALQKMGNSFETQNPFLAKAAKKLNDSGALDKVDSSLSIGSNLEGRKGTSNTKKGAKKATLSSDGTFENAKSQLFPPFHKDNEVEKNSELEASEEDTSSSLFSNSSDFFHTILKYKSVAIYVLPVIIMVSLLLFFAIAKASYDEETGSNTCTYTSNPDASTKKKARITTYTGASLGGSIGPVEQYVKEGTIYYENGYAMWKGGTKSKLNGKVYGEAGTDYMIVAMATRYLFGNQSGVGYSWNEIPGIVYFDYGDTFTVEISFDGGSNYTPYNAIVLDSCGACMEWSLSAPSTWRYSPHATNTNELNKCKESEGYKIDLFRRANNVKGKADMGFYIQGNSSNICVGEVDLGNLVTGVNDTKLLQGQSLNELYGGNTGVTELSNQISQNVKQYGEGTGKGVAAAAISLINSLKSKGYRLPYYWAGGHGSISVGANGSWGTLTSPSCSSAKCYYYNSFDCSGFVSWAIRNGGCTNFNTARTSSGFGSIGKRESVKQVKAGDILVYPGSHVVLVVQNNAGNIMLAESSGGTGGVHFTNYKGSNYENNPNYYFVDMSDFYSSNQCK